MRIVTLLILLLATFSFGKVTSLEMTTSTTNIALESQAVIQVSIISDNQDDIEMPTLPESEEYQLIAKDTRESSSRSMTIVNGRRKSSYEIKTYFLYQIYFPKSGEVIIPSLEIDDNGKIQKTNSITFNVGETKEVIPVKVKFIQSRKELYIGERANLTVRIILNNTLNANVPNNMIIEFLKVLERDLSGNISISLLTKEIRGKRKNINGIPHTIYDFRYTVIPQNIGEVTKGPFPLEYTVEEQNQSRNYSGYSFTNQVRKNMVTPKIKYIVKRLPPAPDNFSGVVGKIIIASEINKKSVKAGENITLTIKVNGKMPPNTLIDLKAPEIDNVEFFTPEKMVKSDTVKTTVYSSKTYKFMMIPRVEGKIIIPSTKLSYFNLETEKYIEVSTNEIEIEVTEGKRKAADSQRYISKSNIKVIGSDIRFIKNSSNYKSNLNPYKSKIMQLFLMLPWIISLVLIIIKIAIKNGFFKSSKTTGQEAYGVALKSLKKSDGNSSAVAVVERYLVDRFSISATSIKREDIISQLKEKNIKDESCEALNKLYNSVELSAYSGGSNSDNVINDATKLIKELEKEVS